MDNGFTFDLSAATWRRSLADEQAFVEALATRLTQALPQTTVERKTHLFSKHQEVIRIVIPIDTTDYLLSVESHGISTSKAKVVRGIRLKTEEVAFETWLSDLSADLSRMAASHQDLRDNLERFLMS